MDFTTLPIGTPVIWDNPNGPVNGVISLIENDEQPVRVSFTDGRNRWFTSVGMYSLDDTEPSLRLVDPVVEKENASSSQGVSPVQSTAPSLPDVWIQFMCAAMSADYSVGESATKADLAMDEYKSRFQ